MISLIAPVYTNKIHKNFWNSILEQKNVRFELIILTNSISEYLTNIIKEVEKKSNIVLQVIFTTRKIGFNEVITNGSKTSSGTHAIVLNVNESLSKNFVNDIDQIIKKHINVDIIEFKVSFRGFENFMPQERCNLKQNHAFKIADFPKVIAFAFPFISNKIFKISLANEVSKKSSYIETSSHLSLEFLYMLFLHSETYVYIDKVLCNTLIEKGDVPNYSNFYKEWKSIRNKYILENKFIQEIEYAQIFNLEMIVPLLYTNKRLVDIIIRSRGVDKNVSAKIFEKNKKLRSHEFVSFNYTNKYMLLNSSETEYLNKSHPPNKWPSIIKILRE